MERRNEVPRLVLGKYLKLMFDHFEAKNILDIEYEVPEDSYLSIYNLCDFYGTEQQNA